jgi:hypothetical protein
MLVIERKTNYTLLGEPILILTQKDAFQVAFIRMFVKVELTIFFGALAELFDELSLAQDQERPAPKVCKIGSLVWVFFDHVLNEPVGVAILGNVLFLQSQESKEWSNENLKSWIHLLKAPCLQVNFDEEVVKEKENEYDRRDHEVFNHC